MLSRITKPIQSITSAAVVVASFSMLSRFAGFIRDRILAGEFGAGDALDIYFAAFKLPDMLFQFVVVGALSASFIPLFTKYAKRGEEGKERAWDFANNTLHVIVFVFLIVTALCFLFAEPLASIIAPGFSADKQLHVAELSRVMFGAQVILAVSMVFGSILQGMKRFVLASIAPIFYNVGIIAGAIFLYPMLGMVGLAWGVMIGAFLHLIVQGVGAWTIGYRYRFIFTPWNSDIRYILKHMIPRLLGLSVNQFNFVVMTMMVSSLSAGSLTILQFAYNLNFFPVGVIGVSFAIAAFPALCESSDERVKYIVTLVSSVKQILLFGIPATILFIALRAQIVRVVLGAGAFDWSATVLTADTMALFVLSLVAQSIVFLLVRAYFAIEDTITPFLIGVLSAGLNIGIIWLTKDQFGIMSFGAAYSASAFVQLILLWMVLRIKVGALREWEIMKSGLTFLFSATVMAIVTQAIKLVIGSNVELNTFWLIFTQGAVAGTIGLIVYFTLNYAMRNPETVAFVDALHGRVLKKATTQETVVSDVS